MSQIHDPQDLLHEIDAFMKMYGHHVPKDDPKWKAAYEQIKAAYAQRGRDLDELNRLSPGAVDEFIQCWIQGKE
jgi:hypothetical protein